jgi:hypothetical protein
MRTTVYHIEISKGTFVGPVKLLEIVANKLRFEHVKKTKKAYTFWEKKFATGVLSAIQAAFPSAKIVKSKFGSEGVIG